LFAKSEPKHSSFFSFSKREPILTEDNNRSGHKKEEEEKIKRDKGERETQIHS